MQGRAAAQHIAGDNEVMKLTDIPNGIYTSPEISSIGRTEQELTEAKIPYEVGHSQFKSLARAQITGRAVGMLKLLFHRETLEILGVHSMVTTDCFSSHHSAEVARAPQAMDEIPLACPAVLSNWKQFALVSTG